MRMAPPALVLPKSHGMPGCSEVCSSVTPLAVTQGSVLLNHCQLGPRHPICRRVNALGASFNPGPSLARVAVSQAVLPNSKQSGASFLDSGHAPTAWLAQGSNKFHPHLPKSILGLAVVVKSK